MLRELQIELRRRVGRGAMSDLKRGVIAAVRGIASLWLAAPSAWLIAAAISVSIALRLVPLYLPVAGAWATQFIHDKVAADLAHGADGRALGHDELESAVVRWMAQNAETVASLRRQAERRFRDALTFEGEDGRRHVYLGGNDGYYWLQLARTELARGSVCDRRDGSVCIDALGNAPIGQEVEYTDSPHVHAIAALHRVITWLIPGFPLSSTSYLVPLLLSAAMVIPAFLLARRLSNRFGGLIAALALSLNSVVFFRTVDSDDDIWEVALPVLATSLLGAAFARERWIARVALAGLAGASLAVLAAAWKGWPLFGLSTLAGLVGVAAWGTIDSLVARVRRRPQSWALPASAAATMLSALAGFAITGVLLGVQLDLGLITGGISGVIGSGPRALGPVDTAPMPDVFRTVAELVTSDAESIAGSLGPFTLGLGLLGFTLPFYTPAPRRIWPAAALGLALVAAAAFLAHSGAGRSLTIGMVLALALGAALAGWLGNAPIPAPAAAAGILGLAWLGATLWMSFDGYRFILLVAVPVSIAAGVSVGRLSAAALTTRLGRSPYRIAGVVAAGGLSAAVIGPVANNGIREAYWYNPLVTSAWAGAFATVRRDSDRNAIVDTWWDYGHWAKYFTERGVVLDGASLQNRNVHWMARALAASTDGESLGLLRMMNCGAVVDPTSGASARPYEMLRRWGLDPAAAWQTVMALTRISPARSAAFLRDAGLDDPRAAALLKTTGCTPPQGFLVISTMDLNLKGWLLSGFWDPGRAYAVELARRRYAPDAAAEILEQRLGLTASEARGLYAGAATVHNEAERAAFVAPDAEAWSADWQSCASSADGLHCTLDLTELTTGVHLQDVIVDVEHPERTRVHVLKRAMGAPIEGTPALVELAEPDHLRDVAPPGATIDLAVLVDPEGRRVFVSRPGVVRSTLARLALLDGRYSPQFQKVFDQLDINRQRVTAWRIVWGQP